MYHLHVWCLRRTECFESPNNQVSGNWSCSVGAGELNPDLLGVQSVVLN